MEVEDGFTEEDCLVDWASPPIIFYQRLKGSM
jgi:hypothetical protein